MHAWYSILDRSLLFFDGGEENAGGGGARNEEDAQGKVIQILQIIFPRHSSIKGEYTT